MTQELIERVAEAIHIARYRQDQEPTPFSGEYADGQQYCRRLALAAIEACDQSQSARIAELRDGLEDAASCLKEAGHTISRLEHGKIGERNFAYVAAEHAASLTKDSTSG